MGRLDGKVAIVTGAASGMGAAFARLFRAEGAQVILTDVQDAAGEAVAASCGGLFIHHDVASLQDWQTVMALAETRFGRLDILVNNAGIMSGQAIDATDLGTWNKVLGVNLTGPMLGCQAAIALMRRNPGGSSGSIVNICSTTAYGALAGDVAYTSSKSAIRMMTKSVAVWCGREGLNIRCNAVLPGATFTGITQAALDAAADPKLVENAMAGMSPFGRIGKPEDVAPVVLFLASDDSAWITGAEYLADGGAMAAHPGM